MDGSGKGLFPPGTARHGPPSAKRRSAHVDRLERQRALEMFRTIKANGGVVDVPSS